MSTAVINIHEAKTHLSRLVEGVARGNDIIIAKAGRPVARLIRFAPVKAAIRYDLLKGKVRIFGDFNAPLPMGALRAFEGK